MGGAGFLAQVIWLLIRNWKPFLLGVVPAMLFVWLVLPPAVASFTIALGFIVAGLLIVGGFFRGLWRGMRGQ